MCVTGVGRVCTVILHGTPRSALSRNRNWTASALSHHHHSGDLPFYHKHYLLGAGGASCPSVFLLETTVTVGT